MISIFSKFKLAGGSERRCVELANSLVNYSDESVFILCREPNFPQRLSEILDSRVNLVLDCLNNPKYFYDSDYILTVNTDSRDFCKIEYWQSFLDMEKMRGKKMSWLFNFIISPSQNLNSFEDYGINPSIITTNQKFFDEITIKEKFDSVRSYPRIILESPIKPYPSTFNKNYHSESFNIKFLSKSYDDKWNNDILKLVQFLDSINLNCKPISVSMMGVKSSLKSDLSKFKCVSLYNESSFPVQDFLSDAHLFIFYPSYKREEPWARVIGEAMSAGCAILALDKSGGTKSQVIDGNNGFLCKDLNSFIDKCVYLITNPILCEKMGKNSKIYSKFFTPENICDKFLKFIKES